MTPEIKEQVIQDYLSGMPVKEIGEKYHIDSSVPGKLTRKAGFPGRQQAEAKASAKVCPKCRKKIDVKGARFCPFCGTDIRTEAEMLVEKLEKTTELYRFLPETYRDDFLATISKAIKIIGEIKCK